MMTHASSETTLIVMHATHTVQTHSRLVNRRRIASSAKSAKGKGEGESGF